MDVDELGTATGQGLDLAVARARRMLEPERVSHRRPRSSRPFSVTVRIDLAHAKPPVWRRVELPSTLHLNELHDVLQLLFGWDDCHLHRFTQGTTVWDRDAEMFLCPYDVESGEDEGVPTFEVRLDEVLAAPGDRLRYVYDYGDEWLLVLVVERVGGVVDRPHCTGGRGNPPPEDSGGAWDWDGSAGPPFDPALLDEELAGWTSERSLPPEITELRRRVAGSSAAHVLQALLDDAELDSGADTVDEAEAAEMTRGYAWLLGRVGSGVKLTQAGWLPPALVVEAMADLGLDDVWIGKGNREDLTEPVRARCGPPPSAWACSGSARESCCPPRRARLWLAPRSGSGGTLPSAPRASGATRSGRSRRPSCCSAWPPAGHGMPTWARWWGRPAGGPRTTTSRVAGWCAAPPITRPMCWRWWGPTAPAAWT